MHIILQKGILKKPANPGTHFCLPFVFNDGFCTAHTQRHKGLLKSKVDCTELIVQLGDGQVQAKGEKSQKAENI